MSSPIMAHTEMTGLHCPTCGVAFALPTVLYDNRRKYHEWVFCPNGHELGWGKDDDDDEGEEWKKGRTPEQIEQQRALVLKIHEQEQAEAREAERRAPAIAVTVAPARPDKAAIAAAVAELAEANRDRKPEDKFTCPMCRKRYRYTTSLAKHVSDHDEALYLAVRSEAGLRAIGLLKENAMPESP